MKGRSENETASGSARAASQVACSARRQAAALLGDLKELSREAVFAKQLRAAECACRLEAVSLDAARSLRRSRYPLLAGHAERLARLSETAAVYLSQTAPEDLWFDTRACVRRHPARAFAAFFLGGLIIGRVLKDSSPGRSSRRETYFARAL